MAATAARRRRGFSLVEAVLVIGILLGILSGLARLGLRWSERETARLAGVEYARFVHAVRTYLAYDPDGGELPPSGALPFGDLNVPGVRAELSGAYWLRHTSCAAGATPDGEGGRARRHYLPCSSSGRTLFGPPPGAAPPANPRQQRVRAHYTTTINRTLAPQRVRVRMAPIAWSGGGRRDDLAGIVARTATTRWMAPEAGGFTPYVIRVDPADGSIIAELSPGGLHEPWLRVDGSNRMQAHLRFSTDGGGAPRYDIEGARNAALSTLAAGAVEVERSIDIGNVPAAATAAPPRAADAKGGVRLVGSGERGAIHLYSREAERGLELSGAAGAAADGLQSGYVHVDTLIVKNGDLVAKPNCNNSRINDPGHRPPGSNPAEKILLSLHSFVPNDPHADSWFHMRATSAADAHGRPNRGWRIRLRGPTPHPGHPFTALASVYCNYNY